MKVDAVSTGIFYTLFLFELVMRNNGRCKRYRKMKDMTHQEVTEYQNSFIENL